MVVLVVFDYVAGIGLIYIRLTQQTGGSYSVVSSTINRLSLVVVFIECHVLLSI